MSARLADVLPSCPFCGRTGARGDRSEGGLMAEHYVTCPWCGARGPVVYELGGDPGRCERQARVEWGKRAGA